MAFCRNCGNKLIENSKFCQKCGCSIFEQAGEYTERKQEYVGKIEKCPNCGEILKSFVRNCPSCGFEFRGVRISSAVREFALKLEEIESKREYEKKGLFSAATALQNVSKTDEQKISLIQSFAIPNTKEDMLEFMILATSNVNFRSYDSSNTNISKGERALNDAWMSKIKQVYEKARHSYGDEYDFQQIQELYDKCNRDIGKSKKKGVFKWVIMLGWLPVFFIVLFAYIGIAGPGAEKKEVTRLESIELEATTALKNGEYKRLFIRMCGIENRLKAA